MLLELKDISNIKSLYFMHYQVSCNHYIDIECFKTIWVNADRIIMNNCQTQKSQRALSFWGLSSLHWYLSNFIHAELKRLWHNKCVSHYWHRKTALCIQFQFVVTWFQRPLPLPRQYCTSWATTIEIKGNSNRWRTPGIIDMFHVKHPIYLYKRHPLAKTKESAHTWYFICRDT